MSGDQLILSYGYSIIYDPITYTLDLLDNLVLARDDKLLRCSLAVAGLVVKMSGFSNDRCLSTSTAAIAAPADRVK